MKNRIFVQRLNAILPAVALLFLFSSCDLFKSVPKEEDKVYDEVPGEIKGGKVYDPQTGKTEEVDNIPTKSDTIYWRKNPPTDAPPIKSDGQNTGGNTDNFPPNNNTGNPTDNGNNSPSGNDTMTPSVMKSSYEVAMMLPFVTNQFTLTDSRIYPKSEWALQYYAGAKIALDQLRGEGISLNINVLDTQGDERKTETELTNPVVANADMIIGPYRSVNVRKVAEFAKTRGIPVVSPYSAASNISNDNPWLVQCRPTLQTHIEKITEHALSKFDASQIVLVVQDKPEERARLALFQQAHREIKKTDAVTPFREFIAPDRDNLENLPIAQYLNRGSNTVFIVPVWSSEVFVNSFLRQVEIARWQGDRISVYGMPQWMEYANTDYDYFEKLSVRVTNAFFVNKNTDEARRFRQTFYDRHGKRAEEPAYLGYDVMLYFGRQINKNGTEFQRNLADNEADLLQTSFRFAPVYEAVPGTDANAPVERYENRYVHMLKFSDYQWRKDL